MAGRNLTKTLDYLGIFARFKDEENIKAVERLLNSHTELEMFERSQLGMSYLLSLPLSSSLSLSLSIHDMYHWIDTTKQAVCVAIMQKKPSH